MIDNSVAQDVGSERICQQFRQRVTALFVGRRFWCNVAAPHIGGFRAMRMSSTDVAIVDVAYISSFMDALKTRPPIHCSCYLMSRPSRKQSRGLTSSLALAFLAVLALLLLCPVPVRGQSDDQPRPGPIIGIGMCWRNCSLFSLLPYADCSPRYYRLGHHVFLCGRDTRHASGNNRQRPGPPDNTFVGRLRR